MAKRMRMSKSTRVNKKATESQHEGKGFLNLPPEIRNIIYDLVIEDQSKPSPRYPNLLFVNHQVYSELAPLAIKSSKTVLTIEIREERNRRFEQDRQLIRLCRMIRSETAAFFTPLTIEESAHLSPVIDYNDIGSFWVKELHFFDIGQVACLLADFTSLATFRWVVNLGRARSASYLWTPRVQRFQRSMNLTIHGLNQMFSCWPMLSRLLIHPNLDLHYEPAYWRYDSYLLQVQAVQKSSGRSVEIGCKRWRAEQGAATNDKSSADVNLVWDA